MNLTALIAQVRLETLIDSTAVSDTQITTVLNNGLLEVSLASEWPWLQDTETITLVAAQKDYALPTAFQFMVAVVDDDHDTVVPYLAPSEYFARFGNDTGNTTTTANFYTIWENEIWFTPIPSANDTARYTCYYYRTVTALTSGSDVPEFNAAFHPVLVEYAKWKLWGNQEYFDQAEQAFITYARYIDAMVSWYGRRVQRAPYIAGDGHWRRPGDPNIPWVGHV